MRIIYLDQLFFLNFVANYLILLGTGRITGVVLHRIRIAVGAAFGGIYAVVTLIPSAVWVGNWACKIAIGVIVVLLAYGGQRRLLNNLISFFCASAGLAGFVMAVEWFGKTALTIQNGVLYSNFDLRLLLLLLVIAYFVMSLFFRRGGRHGARETIKLTICMLGTTVNLTALLDSGHTLTDPMTNHPVVVVNAALFQEFIPDGVDVSSPVEGIKKCRIEGLSNVRLIPYRAIGVECGMLLALKSDQVLTPQKELGGLLIALSPTPVDDGGNYDALIGGI